MAFSDKNHNPITHLLDIYLARVCDETGTWVIAVTGSGGKTTTIEQLAVYWANQGLRVLVSTTTKMLHPSIHTYPFDTFCIIAPEEYRLADAYRNAVTLYGVNLDDKIGAVEDALLQKSIERFDRVLIEADGARTLPLKIHTDRDPVIPSCTNVVIALLGLSALDKKLDEAVMYDVMRFKQLTGYSGSIVNETVYRILLEHPEGVLKGCENLPVVVCCNQSDTIETQRAKQVCAALCQNDSGRPYQLLGFSWHTSTIDFYTDTVEHVADQRSMR